MKPLPQTPGFKRRNACVNEPAVCVMGWELSGYHPDIGPFAIITPSRKGVTDFWDHFMSTDSRKSGMHYVAVFENKNVK